tara:strand:- start:407 stop:652 length:246 start_codon:yes stop_codon:yes gene_type:complete
MTFHNAPVSGTIDRPARRDKFMGERVTEAGPLPALQSYIADDGTAEVIRDCFKHYTRIMQADIGNPDIDLSCEACTRRKKR